MSKLTMLLVLLGAFGYAVWLVAARRAPEAVSGRAGRRRRAFAFLTVYFMHCLGVPMVAGETGGMEADAAGVAFSASENLDFYDSIVAAWMALGYMGRGDMLAHVGAPEVRAAYREAQERKDGNATLALRRAHYDDTREQYRLEFKSIMTEAAVSGKINRKAANLLSHVYDRLSHHFYRMQTTCYKPVMRKSEPRTKDTLGNIERQIRALASGVEPDRKAKYALVLDLERMQEHEIELEEIWVQEYSDAGDTDRSAKAMEKVKKLKAERCGQEDLIQAAEVLLRTAPRLPKDWGEMNAKYD